MAMIECTECKTQISDEAFTCPKCGKPLKHIVQIWSYFQKSKILLVIIICFLFFAGIFLFLYRDRIRLEDPLEVPIQKITEETFFYSQHYTLETSQRVSYRFTVRERGFLTAHVTETFGNNIEFEIRRDGKLIFESGIHSGKAEGILNVERGRYNIVIINNNILDKKTGEFTVHAAYEP